MTILPQKPSSEAADLWTTRLFEDGYCVIPESVPRTIVETLNDKLDDRFARTPFCEGGFYGRRTKRFGALLRRADTVADLIRHPLILEIARNALGPWCECFNLNLTQAIEIHPGAPAQYPHRDQDMWQGAKGQIQYLLNVIWPLSEFTAENGATLVWPGSHNRAALELPPQSDPIVADMVPGAALVFLGSTLHGAGANKSASIRRGIIISYCLGWLKPFENQWLCYPPAIARHFDPELAALVGYSLHRPNLGNYEGQSPAVLLGDNPPDYLAATDALRPDQQAALDGYLAEQTTSDDAARPSVQSDP